eukprot:scaffold540757_cov45-Prasinocladus_malaysianus.AAC.1
MPSRLPSVVFSASSERQIVPALSLSRTRTGSGTQTPFAESEERALVPVPVTGTIDRSRP